MNVSKYVQYYYQDQMTTPKRVLDIVKSVGFLTVNIYISLESWLAGWYRLLLQMAKVTQDLGTMEW